MVRKYDDPVETARRNKRAENEKYLPGVIRTNKMQTARKAFLADLPEAVKIEPHEIASKALSVPEIDFAIDTAFKSIGDATDRSRIYKISYQQSTQSGLVLVLKKVDCYRRRHNF